MTRTPPPTPDLWPGSRSGCIRPSPERRSLGPRRFPLAACAPPWPSLPSVGGCQYVSTERSRSRGGAVCLCRVLERNRARDAQSDLASLGHPDQLHCLIGVRVGVQEPPVE